MTSSTVEVISLGGTIAMATDGAGEVSPRLTADDLVRAVPELEGRVRARSFRQLPGSHLDENDLLELAAHIRTSRNEHSGIVVTQGTDTIEETAFLLDLLVDGDTPVVVTGAMRVPSAPGADGAANLRSAVAVAGASNCRGLGTLVVLNDEIHAAQLVRKSDTFRPHAFVSVPGPLGWVAEGRPQILLRPAARISLPAKLSGAAQPVALVTMSLGDDGSLLRQCRDLGYRGAVVEALGAGHVSASAARVLTDLTRTIPVVLASRTGHGPVLEDTYTFAGSESDLLDHGLIAAGHLDGPKARILLSLLLRAGADRDSVAEFFHRHATAPPAPSQPRTREVSRHDDA